MKIGSPVPARRARIEIIPLIDIMFFLLAAFMLASLSMIRLESVKMDLPTARMAKRDFKPDIVNIAVDKAGGIFIEKQQVNLDELRKFLAGKVRANTNLPVYISGDKDTMHGTIVSVLAAVRNEGVQKVSFTIAPAPPDAAER
jgi:biopolymer transport protein ExbD